LIDIFFQQTIVVIIIYAGGHVDRAKAKRIAEEEQDDAGERSKRFHKTDLDCIDWAKNDSVNAGDSFNCRSGPE
jgi:hypothetical protein